MTEGFRRVITGRGSHGQSIVVTDDRVGFGALGSADFFKTTVAPASITAGDQLDAGGRSALEPPAGGTIFRFFEIPPEQPITDAAQAERDAAAAFEAANASHCRVDTTRHPMMHTTASIDYVVLLRGEVSLLLDEGDELTLGPFDVVIQQVPWPDQAAGRSCTTRPERARIDRAALSPSAISSSA